MVLSKTVEGFEKDFDFTEGIVSEIKWDSNMLDLLIKVYYFWDEFKNKDLIIRFRNCRKATFSMPVVFENIPVNQLENYTLSWFTITGYGVRVEKGLIDVQIKTIDNVPKWLCLNCEEIWIES